MRIKKKYVLIAAITAVAVAMLGTALMQKSPMKNPIVLLETSKGTIEIELYADKAPVTVANFLAYAKSGFYDNTVFHRVIPGFMVQGGGFTLEGTEKKTQAAIKLESANGLKNEIGTIAMARTSEPDSATSQFFINVANNAMLNYAPGNPGYAVFGRVTDGMDVVNSIANAKTQSRKYYDDWPVEDIVIKQATLK